MHDRRAILDPDRTVYSALSYIKCGFVALDVMKKEKLAERYSAFEEILAT